MSVTRARMSDPRDPVKHRSGANHRYAHRFGAPRRWRTRESPRRLAHPAVCALVR